MTHVAIIPDGNRRWAVAKGMSPSDGHRHAVRSGRLSGFIRSAKRLKLTHLSLWVFSTENWKRSALERNALFRILDEMMGELLEVAQREEVRVRWVGRRDRVTKHLVASMLKVERATAKNKSIGFQICLDYGGRDEILRAINRAVKKRGAVTEASFSSLLDTHDIPDPDLIIRTSGEQRLSGFMPWQATYAEFCFVKKHFPAFTPKDLEQAVVGFRARQRRYGK